MCIISTSLIRKKFPLIFHNISFIYIISTSLIGRRNYLSILDRVVESVVQVENFVKAYFVRHAKLYIICIFMCNISTSLARKKLSSISLEVVEGVILVEYPLCLR